MRELLKQALDALEAALSDDQPYIVKCKQSADALRAELAKPEAEPVAYAQNPKEDFWCWCNSDEQGAIALYATPQPAPAVREPLTEREICKLHEASRLNTVTFARSIERAHGIGDSK